MLQHHRNGYLPFSNWKMQENQITVKKNDTCFPNKNYNYNNNTKSNILKMFETDSSINLEIIQEYLDLMDNNYKQMVDSEKNQVSISRNIKLLNKLIDSNIDLIIIKRLIFIIFKLFLDQTNQLSYYDNVKNNNLDLILEFRLNSKDLNLINIYLQLKTSLLRIYTLENKITFTKIVKNYDSNSNFYEFFTFYPNKDEYLSNLITLSFLKLSVSTKTAFKLLFLILATHYSIFTENFRKELLEKINKDATKMIAKSEELVYNLTVNHLYSLVTLCNERNIKCESLDKIIEKYNSIKPHDHYITFENILQLIENKNPNELITNKEFSKQLIITIKNLNMNLPSDEQYFIKIVTFITSITTNLNSLSNIIDLITIKLKDMDCNLKNAQTISFTLTTMVSYLYNTNQNKKLNNFMKLLFHFGNISLSLDSKASLTLWKTFIIFNDKLSDALASKLSTLKRLTFISNDQLLKMNYFNAVIIQLLFLDTFSNHYKYPDEYELILKNELLSSIKIITKSLIKENNSINLFNTFIQDESLLISIVLEVITCVEYSDITDKYTLISKLIVTQKENLKDTGLFLYFLSKISILIDFPINFKNNLLEFNSDSLILNYENLVISHLYILQTFSNSNTYTELTIKCYNSIMKWTENIKIPLTNYEFEIIKTIYFSLKYNKLYKFCSDMMKVYLNKRITNLSKKQVLLIISFIINSNIKLQNYIECKKILSQYKNYISITTITNFEEMNLLIDIFQYNILINNSIIENSLLNQIYQTFTKNEDFKIENQTDKYKAVELLMLYSKFCKTSGLHSTYNHLNAITNFNRSISILQSLFKNFLLPNEKASSLNINFKSVLKMRFSYEMLDCYMLLLNQYSIIGFGKEFDHYLKELDLFVKIQPSNNLQYYINIKLVDFNVFKGCLNDATNYFNNVNSVKLKICDDGNKLMNINTLIIFENYSRKIGDSYLVKLISNELNNEILGCIDSYLEEFIKRQKLMILGRRYENRYESDTTLPNIDNKFDFHIIKSIELLNNLKNSLKNTISCYPIVKNHLVDKRKNDRIEKLTELNSFLIKNFRKMFEEASIEYSKTSIDMILNCFLDIVNSNNSIGVNNEMKEIGTLNDQFKNYPFLLEKQFAQNNSKQKFILPEISNDIPRIVMKNNNNLKDILPTDWQVLTIDYIYPTNSLVLFRYNSKYDEPLFINISLANKDSKYSFKNTLSLLNDIIKESDQSTSLDVTQNIKTYEQKLKWWETRKSLDKRLEKLLMNIDSEWFGGFNSLFQFSSVNNEDIEIFKVELINIVSSFLSHSTAENEQFKQKMMNIHDGIYELFLKIDHISVDKIIDLLWFLFETIGLKTILTNSDDTVKIANIVKDKIILLLKKKIIDDDSNFHVVLIPASNCTKIPWESIPSLRSKSVTRMPTLSQLETYLIKYKNLLGNGIDSCKGYYVINPGNDLKRTEANLGPRFTNLDGWEGIIGKAPNELDILKAFDEKNLYIYAGHGGGEQYIKSKNIKKRDYIPPSLLLGCSSGLLKGGELIHPYGTSYNYINGGCPMLLVNLWDVTDKDIDLFTVEILTKWGFFVDYDSFDPFDISINNPTLPQCVAKSKDVCKLKYLNGAAPIIYGLPLRLEIM